jgi:hypothetical protein
MVNLRKWPLLAVFAVLLFSGFVGVVFANPIPMEPFGSGTIIQYLAIVLAEVCGLVAGTGVLSRNGQIHWRKAAVITSLALIVSYTLGLAIWAFGHASGVLVYNSVPPLFGSFSGPVGALVFLLPELLGTIVGTILIRFYLRVEWKLAFIAMACAMLASFLVGLLIANIYLRIY